MAAFFSDGANLIGTAREMEKLLEGNLPPEQIASIMADVLGPGERSIWDRISNGSEAALASYLLKDNLSLDIGAFYEWALTPGEATLTLPNLGGAQSDVEVWPEGLILFFGMTYYF